MFDLHILCERFNLKIVLRLHNGDDYDKSREVQEAEQEHTREQQESKRFTTEEHQMNNRATAEAKTELIITNIQ